MSQRAPRPSSSSRKLAISQDEWGEKLQSVDVKKNDLNRLVMDYLVIEGYREAAEQFSRESGLQPTIDLQSIEHRMNIRNAIQRGDIEEAIERVNDLNPDILEQNPALFFHLQQQRLIELIRQGKVVEALTFAQQELAPQGEDHPQFLAELERTMALLAFDPPSSYPPSSTSSTLSTSIKDKDKDKSGDSHAMPSNLVELLMPSQRQATAAELNAAILTSQSHGKDPKLPWLIRMLAWGETMLEERVGSFPKLDLQNKIKSEAGDVDSMMAM